MSRMIARCVDCGLELRDPKDVVRLSPLNQKPIEDPRCVDCYNRAVWRILREQLLSDGDAIRQEVGKNFCIQTLPRSAHLSK